jgi:hypothetical protein
LVGNTRCSLFARLLAILLASTSYAAAQELPKLLLSPPRLKRLDRDRTRQTERWQNLQDRIRNEPGSSERGMELALAAKTSKDVELAGQAIQWAKQHPEQTRQVALVVDWCGDSLTAVQREEILTSAWKAYQRRRAGEDDPVHYRDGLMLRVERGEEFPEAEFPRDISRWWNGILPHLKSRDRNWLVDPEQLYALCEIFDIVRLNSGTDLRSDDAEMFASLPMEYLLSLHPQDVTSPSWKTRTAALALVGIDPNLAGAQYLQGWALEDPQVMRSGPGVVYEFLWANPYLPGISYYNLDPWSYDQDAALLYARTSWEADSCWIRITVGGVSEQNCPADWKTKPFTTGRMTLVPFSGGCVDLPKAGTEENPHPPATILWGLTPRTRLTYKGEKKPIFYHADAAGMFLAPNNGEDRICVAAGK